MRVAPAKDPRQRLLNVRIGCFGIPVQVGFCGHDDAAEAKAALHGLLIDERFLNRMRLRARSQTFERRDLRARDVRWCRDKSADGVSSARRSRSTKVWARLIARVHNCKPAA